VKERQKPDVRNPQVYGFSSSSKISNPHGP